LDYKNKQIPIVLIGQIIKINILKFDRSKVDACTLLGVVLHVVDGDYYPIGTKAGTLFQLFT